jgi:glutamate 5-kinase
MMNTERNDILKHAKRILVKIGSGVLTGGNGLDLTIIENIVDEIAAFTGKGYQFVVVSSGAIASGRHRMGLTHRLLSLPEKQAAAAIGQGRLMRVYANAFGKHNLIVAQMLLTMSDLTDRTRFLNTRNTLNTLLEWGVIPVINENDTVAVEEIKFGDNDNLASMMANIMEANILINLTNTDGLFDRNPKDTKKKSTLIPLVREITDAIEEAASTEADPVGMGGMKSKVMAAKKVTAFGIPFIIAPGKKKGVLSDIFAGKNVGTLFLPMDAHLKSKKHWIAYTLRSRGKLHVDEGAKLAITRQGKSLLPGGVLSVEGNFSVGDPVSCIDEHGEVFAKGLVNYSSVDIDKIKGLKTAKIKQVLGGHPYDEIIHRDNMAVSKDNGN